MIVKGDAFIITTPKLRFKGFNEPWHETKLGKIYQVNTGKSKYNKNNKSLNYKVLGSVGIVGYSSIYDYEGNFVLIARVGMNAGSVYKYSGKIKITDNTIYIKTQNNLFTYLLLSHKDLKRLVFGSGQPLVKSSDIKSLKIAIPTIQEQTKIGLFFDKLDKLINLQQAKVNALKSLKNGYLQKLFVGMHSTTPQLRFKGFNDPWKETKIGNLATIVRGASPRPISNPKWFDNNSNVGWLRIADVTNQHGRIRYLKQKISKLGQEKTRVLTTPHLLLSIAATVGSPVINYVNTGVHDGFLIFKDPKFNKDFMFQWLLYYKNYWQKYGQPGSQVNLNSSIVNNQKITIPNIQEQARIANFMASIDKQITNQTNKLKHLKATKRGFLQKLFV